MTNASLARKRARLAGFQQEAAAHRATGALGAFAALSPGGTVSPSDLLAEEQDRRRENLAERLLEIFAEEIGWESAADDATEQANATRAATCAAHAALAAATVLYPEVPAETQAGE